MYAKLFRSLFYGSLSGMADPQHVFMCLLTHTDRDGYVELPPPVISALTGLPLERVSAAITVLESTDPRSRSDAEGGRRLQMVGDGRWLIINYCKYRAIRNEDDRRDQNRQAKAKQRLTKQSARVSQGQPRSAHTEAEVEAEVDAKADTSPPLPEWLPAEAWGRWKDYRLGIATKKSPWNKSVMRSSLRTLERLWRDGQNLDDVIEQSVLNGWRGLFPVNRGISLVSKPHTAGELIAALKGDAS